MLKVSINPYLECRSVMASRFLAVVTGSRYRKNLRAAVVLWSVVERRKISSYRRVKTKVDTEL